MATVRVCGSEYSPGEQVTIFAQILNDAGEPVNDADVILNLFDANGLRILDDVTMDYLIGSNGLYRHSFIAPLNIIRMVADVKSLNPVAYGVEDLGISLKAQRIGEIKLETDHLPDDLDNIAAKTDKIPNDPAIQSLIEARIAAAFSEIKGTPWTDETLKLIKKKIEDLELQPYPSRASVRL